MEKGNDFQEQEVPKETPATEPTTAPETPAPEPTLVPVPEAPEQPEPKLTPEVPEPPKIPEIQPNPFPEEPATKNPDVVEPLIFEKAPSEAEGEAAQTGEPRLAPLSKMSYADAPERTVAEHQSEIKTKWNWGAFSFTMWFGIAHRAYLGLLILLGLIPWIGWIFALVWMIIFGLNGEKWALENTANHYRDEEEFRKIMDGWNRAGLIAFIVGIVAFVLLAFLLVAFVIFMVNSIHMRENYLNFNNF
ncbi:hypothetical protein [Lactococcus kimchii]|uniref:hypothetical protein n=1 Tax=Lactococcus sp. S-13 TaxID=2507158 RepID=UPI0010231D13|nr:hypothetical protein [Lactococcus sp. S-13]RZI49350.1 hypothetical protein EQJ87_07800 [Lactococcus sp. S-13]